MVKHSHTSQNGVSRKTPTYFSWQAMRRRCNDPSDISYHRYGAAGITVCKEWDSFARFLSDMGEKPKGIRISIGRIDNLAGYSKENCQWETPRQQAFNRYTTRRITHNGETLSISGWAKKIGIHKAVLRRRLLREQSIEVALRPKGLRVK